jgi:replication factor A1
MAMIEKIIEEILSRRPEISREEVMEKLEKEKRRTGGLISDEVLLRMIAAEFGVEILGEAQTPTLSIKDLVSGLNDVTVVGRVVAVFPPKIFEVNRRGKVASLLIADKSGILRVTMWNDKVSLIESGKVKVGQIIRVFHGYAKEGYGGKVELHVGEKSEIEINPQYVKEKDYPTITKLATKIWEVSQTSKGKKVNFIGNVKEVFPVSTFKRQDSSSGKVMRLILADETGEIPVVVWNEKVDELENKLRKGVKLQVVNAKVKKASNKVLEAHVDSGTYVDLLMPAEEFLKITDLKAGLNNVGVEGEVATKPMLREVKTSKGELVKLAVFELKDETGRIWVSAWRKHADIVSNLKVGDKLIVKSAYVKRGFGDKPEISTRSTTSIEIQLGNRD